MSTGSNCEELDCVRSISPHTHSILRFTCSNVWCEKAMGSSGMTNKNFTGTEGSFLLISCINSLMERSRFPVSTGLFSPHHT